MTPKIFAYGAIAILLFLFAAIVYIAFPRGH